MPLKIEQRIARLQTRLRETAFWRARATRDIATPAARMAATAPQRRRTTHKNPAKANTPAAWPLGQEGSSGAQTWQDVAQGNAWQGRARPTQALSTEASPLVATMLANSHTNWYRQALLRRPAARGRSIHPEPSTLMAKAKVTAERGPAPQYNARNTLRSKALMKLDIISADRVGTAPD